MRLPEGLVDLYHDLAAGVPACDTSECVAGQLQRKDGLDLRLELAGVDKLVQRLQ
jgi:hypothetical protein